jgi:hypothetical protein
MLGGDLLGDTPTRRDRHEIDWLTEIGPKRGRVLVSNAAHREIGREIGPAVDCEQSTPVSQPPHRRQHRPHETVPVDAGGHRQARQDNDRPARSDRSPRQPTHDATLDPHVPHRSDRDHGHTASRTPRGLDIAVDTRRVDDRRRIGSDRPDRCLLEVGLY